MGHPLSLPGRTRRSTFAGYGVSSVASHVLRVTSGESTKKYFSRAGKKLVTFFSNQLKKKLCFQETGKLCPSLWWWNTRFILTSEVLMETKFHASMLSHLHKYHNETKYFEPKCALFSKNAIFCIRSRDNGRALVTS